MTKAPATRTVKGIQLADLQYFRWLHTATKRKAIVENGTVTHGPPYQERDNDFCYSYRGVVYYGTNGSKTKMTLAEIDADPDSEIEALDQFCETRPTY